MRDSDNEVDAESDAEIQGSRATKHPGIRRSELHEYSWDSVPPFRVTKFTPSKSQAEAHGAGVYCCRFSADDSMVATAGHDCKVTVRDASSGEKNFSMLGHNGWVTQLAFSPNGQYIVSCSNGEVIVWSLQSKKWFFFLGKVHDGLVNGCDWAFWDSIKPEDDAFNPNLNADKVAEIRRRKKGELTWAERRARYEENSKQRGERDSIGSLGVIVSGGNDRRVRLWELPASQDRSPIGRGIIQCEEQVNRVRCHPSERLILAGLGSGVVVLLSAASGKTLSRFEGHADAVLGVAWAHQNLDRRADVSQFYCAADPTTMFATCSHDQMVMVWSTGQPMPLYSLSGHTSLVTDVVFGPESKQKGLLCCRLFSCSADIHVIVWDAKSGAKLKSIRSPHRSWLTSMALSTCGRRFVTSSMHIHTSLIIWDADLPRPSVSEVLFHMYDSAIPVSWRGGAISFYESLPKRMNAAGEEVSLFSVAGMLDVYQELGVWVRVAVIPWARDTSQKTRRLLEQWRVQLEATARRSRRQLMYMRLHYREEFAQQQHRLAVFLQPYQDRAWQHLGPAIKAARRACRQTAEAVRQSPAYQFARSHVERASVKAHFYWQRRREVRSIAIIEDRLAMLGNQALQIAQRHLASGRRQLGCAREGFRRHSRRMAGGVAHAWLHRKELPGWAADWAKQAWENRDQWPGIVKERSLRIAKQVERSRREVLGRLESARPGVRRVMLEVKSTGAYCAAQAVVKLRRHIRAQRSAMVHPQTLGGTQKDSKEKAKLEGQEAGLEQGPDQGARVPSRGEMLSTIFQHFDHDNDGVLSFREFTTLLQALKATREGNASLGMMHLEECDFGAFVADFNPTEDPTDVPGTQREHDAVSDTVTEVEDPSPRPSEETTSCLGLTNAGLVSFMKCASTEVASALYKEAHLEEGK